MRIATLGILLISLSAHAEALTGHWINTGMNNRDITISPDGKTLLSTLMAPANQFAVIVISSRGEDGWSEPEVAPFSGRFPDIEPMFSPDGSRLFFASKRPKPDREGDDWDLWYVTLSDRDFSEPVNIGAPVNTPGDEFYPSITDDGSLYFTAERESGPGREDIFRARHEQNRYVDVEPLGSGVNSEGFEFNAFVSPDGAFIIFSSQGREDELGRGDLYISMADETGVFQPATPLPVPANSTMLDYCPYVWGDVFYFASRRSAENDGRMDYAAVRGWFEGPGNGLGDIFSMPLKSILPKAP